MSGRFLDVSSAAGDDIVGVIGDWRSAIATTALCIELTYSLNALYDESTPRPWIRYSTIVRRCEDAGHTWDVT